MKGFLLEGMKTEDQCSASNRCHKGFTVSKEHKMKCSINEKMDGIIALKFMFMKNLKLEFFII
jgi:hypothetical protein